MRSNKSILVAAAMANPQRWADKFRTMDEAQAKSLISDVKSFAKSEGLLASEQKLVGGEPIQEKTFNEIKNANLDDYAMSITQGAHYESYPVVTTNKDGTQKTTIFYVDKNAEARRTALAGKDAISVLGQQAAGTARTIRAIDKKKFFHQGRLISLKQVSHAHKEACNEAELEKLEKAGVEKQNIYERLHSIAVESVQRQRE